MLVESLGPEPLPGFQRRERLRRIRIFTSLRLEELDKLTLKRRLDEIGRVRLPSAEAS